jgi:hypothetical protein
VSHPRCEGCKRLLMVSMGEETFCEKCRAPKPPPIAAVIDPRGKNDAEIREFLRELLESPHQLDAFACIFFFRDGDDRTQTKVELRRVSDLELGFMSAYFQGYAQERIRG